MRLLRLVFADPPDDCTNSASGTHRSRRSGRSYGRAIDEQLAQEREASPRMNHYAQAGAALLSLPILGASEPVIGSLACPRNAWGWATLLRIGQVLAAPAGTEFLRERMAARLSPEARRQHSHRLEQFYKDRSQRSRPQ